VEVFFAFSIIATLIVAGASAASAAESGSAPDTAVAAEVSADDGAGSDGGDANRFTRNGLTIEFSTGAVRGSFEEERALYAQDYAVVKFTITDAASGEPVSGLIPGAWIDLVESEDGKKSQALDCKDRIGVYIRGSTANQALVDLNSYFILAMNEDSTISVIDPNVMIAGIGDMFYTQVILPRPGADWAQTEDQTRLFVTMPRANAVAVIDTGTFKLIRQIKTGVEPVRIALQNDERYLWVANNAKGKLGSVTVIDAKTYEVVTEIETGRGHHEIAFSGDDRYALVTNRDDGTVSVIDVQTLRKVKDIDTGKVVMSIGYSELSRSFYVADGQTGQIAVIDGRTLEVTGRIEAKQGLGPMTVTQDGRWVLVTNAAADLLHVVDTSANTLKYSLRYPGKPYQVSVTRAFAYIRALENERVGLIELSKLEQPGTPPIVPIPLGGKAPKEARSISIASGIAEAAGEAGVIALNPAEDTLYFYMEGMNAPMGSFRSYGHSPRAVTVTDRSLVESEPGVYSARTQIPSAGRYEAALVLDSPPVLHCFSFTAVPNPELKRDLKPLAVDYLVDDYRVPAEQEVTIRFRLTDPASEQALAGIEDARVLFYRAPFYDRTEVAARDVGDGVYEAALPIGKAGAYYVYVGVGSKNMPFGAMPFLTLRAMNAGATAAPQSGG